MGPVTGHAPSRMPKGNVLMLEAEIARVMTSEREQALLSPVQAQRERWLALRRMDRLDRELRRTRRRWSSVAFAPPTP